MIQALDHVVVAAKSVDAAVSDYEMLFGRRADGASIRLGNTCLRLQAGDAGLEGLSGLGLAVADLAKAERLVTQRALSVAKREPGAALELAIAPATTHGVSIKLVERAGEAAAPSALLADEAAAVTGLDHIVVRSPNPERAIALYAGRLGLSLRLDRTEPAWGARLVFFRCGDLVLEVAHDLGAGIGDGPDRLWGLSWRVPDVVRARARLQAAGVAVSDVRTGRRPGTQVFTVKSHIAGVPTLMIGPA